ncbi:MAG: endonuclease domain-containing protein, partial [Longimicrobiales bacterium]
LFDLAGVAGVRELEQALAEATNRRLASQSELLSLASRHARRRGIQALRRMLEDDAGPLLVQSDAEERFLGLIRKARLPVPEANTRVGAYKVDFLWRPERLVVEVDGFTFHSSRGRFESDRRRDADLSAQGFRVIRVTWRQVTQEPEVVLVRLAQTLARSGTR